MSFKRKLVIAMKNINKLDSKNIDKILTCSAYNHTVMHSYLATAETGNIA
jgi:hypothetical protein